MEQHKLELMKEREKHKAQTAGLRSELDSIKELLQTYETSNQRKDEVPVSIFFLLKCRPCHTKISFTIGL